MCATFKNFILRQSVSFGIFVPCADSAIKAVVFAVVCKFYKPSDKNFFAVSSVSDIGSLFEKILRELFISVLNEFNKFFLTLHQIKIREEISGNELGLFFIFSAP